MDIPVLGGYGALCGSCVSTIDTADWRLMYNGRYPESINHLWFTFSTPLYLNIPNSGSTTSLHCIRTLGPLQLGPPTASFKRHAYSKLDHRDHYCCHPWPWPLVFDWGWYPLPLTVLQVTLSPIAGDRHVIYSLNVKRFLIT